MTVKAVAEGKKAAPKKQTKAKKAKSESEGDDDSEAEAVSTDEDVSAIRLAPLPPPADLYRFRSIEAQEEGQGCESPWLCLPPLNRF